jgi:hypothetical protein
MLQDIERKKMEGFSVAMIPVPPADETEAPLWECYLINLKEEPVTDVFVTSRGYTARDGEHQHSSTLRYYHRELGPRSAVLLELIPVEIQGLTNEFWVSYRHRDYMYDKRFLFVEGSLQEDLCTLVPILEKRGVMIR